MARAHFVTKAAKDNPVAKKGESYYWWKHMVGGRGGPKQYSKTPPKPQQLTQSDYYRSVYDLADEIAALDSDMEREALREAVELIKENVETLRDEQEEKKNNLPDSLQEGPTGELLQERYDALDSAASELDAIDLDGDLQEIVDVVQAVSLC